MVRQVRTRISIVLAPGMGAVYTHFPSCDPPWSVRILREPCSSPHGAVLTGRKIRNPGNSIFSVCSKTGGRLIKHAQYYWLMLAESHLTRRLFGSMVRRIDALTVATG